MRRDLFAATSQRATLYGNFMAAMLIEVAVWCTMTTLLVMLGEARKPESEMPGEYPTPK